MLNYVLTQSYYTLYLYINLALNTINNKTFSIAVILRWWLSSLPWTIQIAITRGEHESPPTQPRDWELLPMVLLQ